jgi:hypothetical protein
MKSLKTSQNLKKKISIENLCKSDSRDDECMPYYTHEDCDTSWWDDDLNHD